MLIEAAAMLLYLRLISAYWYFSIFLPDIKPVALEFIVLLARCVHLAGAIEHRLRAPVGTYPHPTAEAAYSAETKGVMAMAVVCHSKYIIIAREKILTKVIHVPLAQPTQVPLLHCNGRIESAGTNMY